MHLAQAEALAEMEAATRQRLAAEAVVNWQRLDEADQAMARHADWPVAPWNWANWASPKPCWPSATHWKASWQPARPG